MAVWYGCDKDPLAPNARIAQMSRKFLLSWLADVLRSVLLERAIPRLVAIDVNRHDCTPRHLTRGAVADCRSEAAFAPNLLFRTF